MPAIEPLAHDPQATEPLTVTAALRDLAATFRAARLDSPGPDARLLTMAATGLARERILAEPDTPMQPHQTELLARFRQRRLAHEPVSRILGVREFYGRPFQVTPAVLDPRADSETLIEAVLARSTAAPLRMLDLGTGSACLLLTLLAERPDWHGVGVDISAPALDTAMANAQSLGLHARCQWQQRDFTKPAALASLGLFEIAISNPPYIATSAIGGLAPEVRLFDPWLALDGGDDGLSAYRALLALPLVCPGGLLALEIGHGMAPDIEAMLVQSGWQEIVRHADLSGTLRVLSARQPGKLVTQV